MAFELQLVSKNSTCALNIFFLFLSDSKSNSWYSFSWEVLRIAHVIIIVNLFIVDDKDTIKNIFVSTNIALNTWLIKVSF